MAAPERTMGESAENPPADAMYDMVGLPTMTLMVIR